MHDSTNPGASGARRRANAAIFGFLATAVALIALLLPRLNAEKSGFASFCQIRMAMSKSQVDAVLQDHKTPCQWRGLGPAGEKCEFTDFWREYRIVLDLKTDKVVRKSFTFKPFRFVTH